ncbi:MAG: phage head completion protein [Beijerinckiaceae bacterium]
MISKLRHRLTLCRQEDVISGPDDMRLNRTGIVLAWASIEAKKASTFSPFGAAMKEGGQGRTHLIKMRYRPDLNISSMAWLYEERLQSSPRWFKILAVNQSEQSGSPYFILDCRLIERGDNSAAPTEASGPVMDLPSGVKL